MIRAGRGHFTPELVPPVPYSHAICTSCCVSSREGTICIRSCTQHLYPDLHTAPPVKLAHSTCTQASTQHLQPSLPTAPATRLTHSTSSQACPQHLHPGLHPAPAARLPPSGGVVNYRPNEPPNRCLALSASGPADETETLSPMFDPDSRAPPPSVSVRHCTGVCESLWSHDYGHA